MNSALQFTVKENGSAENWLLLTWTKLSKHWIALFSSEFQQTPKVIDHPIK